MTSHDQPGLPNHWAAINDELTRLGAVGRAPRPHYAWCVLHAARVAASTGVGRISVLEVGVAGGNGLVALEAAAADAAAAFGVEVDVYGFDTGRGLPEPKDPRDAPFLMEEGDFPMDPDALRSRLQAAELVLGGLAETVGPFLDRGPAPVGFIAFDVDYYSSTRDALALLAGPVEALQPRVITYFDDVHGYPCGDSNGARLAIRQFNESHGERKVDQLHGLRHLLPRLEFEARWPEAIYLAHVFDHPRYADFEGTQITRRLDLETE
jgi:hypothetical protein